MKLIKLALRREEGYPVGQPAPCYLLCPCGRKVPVPPDAIAPLTCDCGAAYTPDGWIVTRTKGGRP
jgi:hypothetical protein